MKNVKSKLINRNLKVAIVCDWLTGTGGAERVVLELHRMFPEAPIFTSQYDTNPKIWYGDKWFSDADVRTTWLQKLPKGLRKFLPVLRAWTFSRLNLNDYDLVISSSGAEAKFVKTKSLHISYCHAPTHYYWSRYDEYMKHPGFGALDPLARLGLKILAGPMRRWDKKAAGRPDVLIANSTYTQKAIKRYYARDSIVIHPPVDVERFKLLNKSSNLRTGFVTAGRQTPYKKIDLAVEACTKLNLPLKVIGNGPDHKKLQAMAGPSVEFLTNISDEEMKQYFQSAEAFIFPGIDDFGIVAVEALAAGTPVIAYGEGGALDYINNETGLTYKPQTAGALEHTLADFKKLLFDHQKVAESAQKFAPANFRKQISNLIGGMIKNG